MTTLIAATLYVFILACAFVLITWHDRRYTRSHPEANATCCRIDDEAGRYRAAQHSVEHLA